MGTRVCEIGRGNNCPKVEVGTWRSTFIYVRTNSGKPVKLKFWSRFISSCLPGVPDTEQSWSERLVQLSDLYPRNHCSERKESTIQTSVSTTTERKPVASSAIQRKRTLALQKIQCKETAYASCVRKEIVEGNNSIGERRKCLDGQLVCHLIVRVDNLFGCWLFCLFRWEDLKLHRLFFPVSFRAMSSDGLRCSNSLVQERNKRNQTEYMRQYMRHYRQRIKQNPIRHQQYRERQRMHERKSKEKKQLSKSELLYF